MIFYLLDNWALIYAQRLALKEKVPLFVCFCLVPTFLQATLRQYGFMLKGKTAIVSGQQQGLVGFNLSLNRNRFPMIIIGLKQVRLELVKLKIPFSLLFGEAGAVLPSFVEKHRIGGIVTDFAPLRVPRKWVDEVSKKLPDVPLCQV